MKIFMSLIFFMISFSCLFGGITGRYNVHAVNEDGSTYTSVLRLRKEGKVYHAKWVTAGGDVFGVGVRDGNYIAFDFFGDINGEHILGVQLYQIFKDRLVGPGVINEEGMIAQETAIKIKKH